MTDKPEEPTPNYGRACKICGELGPCGLDAEGRPMIHTEEETEVGD